LLRRTTATPEEKVWCVRNDLGTLVVRRKGKVAIVGNCAGRVHRDGQTDPVAVYYLLSDEGSDPVVADVLGIKRAQIEGLRDPMAPRVEAVTTKDGALKRLAEEYLAQRGVSRG
jgi:hypothetical protein